MAGFDVIEKAARVMDLFIFVAIEGTPDKSAAAADALYCNKEKVSTGDVRFEDGVHDAGYICAERLSVSTGRKYVYDCETHLFMCKLWTESDMLFEKELFFKAATRDPYE